MTPTSALTALVARLNAAGLKEARSPLGVRNEASPRMDRSFSVRLGTLSPSSSPGRGRADVPGLRVTQSLTVELCHKLAPNEGQAAPSQALTDLHSTWKHLSAANTSLTQGVSLQIGAASGEYVGSGGYLIHSYPVLLTYNLTLVV